MTERILLVEDDTKLAGFIEAELSLEGYHIRFDRSGLIVKQVDLNYNFNVHFIGRGGFANHT